MKFIIPIKNLFIEEFINLENVWFLPSRLYDQEHSPFDEEEISKDTVEQIYNILNNCAYEYMQHYQEYSIAILEYPFTVEEFNSNAPMNDFYTLEKVCYRVDRALDQIRLKKCNFLNKEMLPGIAGIIENYQCGIVVNMETNYSREMLGKVYGIHCLPGIGLEVDSYDIGFDEESKYLFRSDRTDPIFFKCRNAITRINEAYYFNNINTSFVYLMSTLDMLASDNYIRFSKVKTNIVSFIATNKSEYHNKCHKLREISEDIRTDIVHNGKNLYDIIENEYEINKLLGFIVGIIIDYCINVIKLEIYNEDELVKERDRRVLELTT